MYGPLGRGARRRAVRGRLPGFGWRRQRASGGGDCGGKIAIFGAFTGPNAGLVLPSLNGAKLAVKQYNAANATARSRAGVRHRG